MTSARIETDAQGRPAFKFPNRQSDVQRDTSLQILSCVLVFLDIVLADLTVTIRLNVRLNIGLASAELLFGIANGILGFTESLLHFAFGLLAHSFELLLFVVGDLAEFLLRVAGDVLHFAFDLIAVHNSSPLN